MERRLPPLNALRAFEAAGRHLSFTRAARELHVTPAAISHQIKALEAYLGVRLFRRRPQGLLLTDAGQQALPGIGEGLDRLAQAVSGLRRMERNRPLTVSVTPSFASKWLVPRIERFRSRHPDIELRIDASDQLADLRDEDVDVAVRHGLGDYPGLHVEKLPAQEVFPVCSPELLHAERPLRAPGDLRHHTLLHLDWRGSHADALADWPMWLASAGVTGVDPSAGPRFSQGGLAAQAAAEGRGVALLSTFLVADDLAAGRLVRPFAHALAEDFSYFFVCLPEGVDMPRIRAFRDWLLRELGVCTDEPA